MDDQLLPWLRAQIAETVRIAQTVQAKEAPSPWLRRGQRLVRYNNGGDEGYEAVSVRHHGGAWERIRVMRDLDGTVADHIVRHDPRAVLAQCEAHIALLDQFDERFSDLANWEPILRALALAYQHCPGYRPEWKP